MCSLQDNSLWCVGRLFPEELDATSLLENTLRVLSVGGGRRRKVKALANHVEYRSRIAEGRTKNPQSHLGRCRFLLNIRRQEDKSYPDFLLVAIGQVLAWANDLIVSDGSIEGERIFLPLREGKGGARVQDLSSSPDFQGTLSCIYCQWY